MGDPKQDAKNRDTTKYYKQRIDRAQKIYDKKLSKTDERIEKREEFLKKNDERLAKMRQRTDEKFVEYREKTNARLEKNRKAISEKYVKGDKEKEQKLNQRIQKTDEYIAKKRKKSDEDLVKHREKVEEKRKKHDEKVKEFFLKSKLRQLRKLKRVEEDRKNVLAVKKFRILIYIGVALFAIIIALEFWLPGSKLKEEGIIDETTTGNPIVPPAKAKRYYVLEKSEEQLLWDLLYEHFDGNQTAVLGVMCNLKAESNMKAGTLENVNNEMWGIDDENYTEKINLKSIDEKDFLESRYNNVTNGYLNDYSQWVNRDGGYGYAQYTAYEEKQYLYAFAEDWFSEDGPGSEYKFNIGDPDMQAHYIVHILESDRYKNMDTQIRNCTTVVDACYIWLKTYEIPYDPYNDNYFTLAFDRAANADEILESCSGEDE